MNQRRKMKSKAEPNSKEYRKVKTGRQLDEKDGVANSKFSLKGKNTKVERNIEKTE